MWIGGVGRYKGLRLGGNRSEDAFLLEALAVGTTTVVGRFEARATDLNGISMTRAICIEPRFDVPCVVYNIDTRWPSSAWVPVDSDSPCEVAPWSEDPEAHRESTYHEVASRIAYRGDLVEGEVESPSRQVLMENFRNRVEEGPLQVCVSTGTGKEEEEV